jgi:hypothetical protein
MSPIKNSFSKHIVFNLAGKNLSYTARKWSNNTIE